jgi:hypothetical protein
MMRRRCSVELREEFWRECIISMQDKNEAEINKIKEIIESQRI